MQHQQQNNGQNVKDKSDTNQCMSEANWTRFADETVTNYGTSTSICGCTRANCRHKFADGLSKSLKKDYQVQQINNSFLKREYHQPPANNHTVPLLRNP